MGPVGAWGTGPFDNDDAGDWFYALEESGGLGPARAALTEALAAGDYLELPEANNAVAAAAIIAATLDKAVEGLPEHVGTWLGAGHDDATADDARLALRALDRVTGENSEAAELWEESDSVAGWTASIDDLRARLRSAAG